MRRESPLLAQAKKQARERALFLGNCECTIASHDHGIMDCHRKLKVRYYFHWKPGEPHFAHADNIMVVCSTCHSQISSAHGRIY
jgi:hypothetical protein